MSLSEKTTFEIAEREVRRRLEEWETELPRLRKENEELREALNRVPLWDVTVRGPCCRGCTTLQAPKRTNTRHDDGCWVPVIESALATQSTSK